LVDKVVPAEELESTVGDLAKRLSKGPTKAIAMAKVTINRSLNMDLESALDYVGNLNFSLLQTDDYKEGFKAFLEKRNPVFQGR
jgi:2-(1,2-epoxy-1,2-dihydrophenyl)acetyl-CoA isomerase